jgi:metal-sulfur cluster biosynthetic enzyme
MTGPGPDGERFVVTKDTVVAEVLERIPGALELLVSYGFTPLTDPAIRETVSPHVRLETGSRVHNFDLEALLCDLNRLAEQASDGGSGRPSRQRMAAVAPLLAPRVQVDTAGILNALRGCRDPEVPFNVVDLGMVYDIQVEGEQACVIMTLSNVDCASAGQLVAEVAQAIRGLGVPEVEVKLVREPPWDPSRAAPVARAALGWT